MLAGLIALTLAAAFCSAALYINIAEHPARMLLDDAHALAQWGPSYDRAFNYQGGLAVLSSIAGFVQAWLSGHWLWAAGATLMLVNWPYTLMVILPLNHRLKAIAPAAAGPESRAMLGRWNYLHAVRTRLSACAVVIFLLAASHI
jgi:Domain of unknown function (DUF1772)